jgi:hypothetical protein
MFKRSKKAPESKTSDVPEEEEVTAASDVDRLIANAVAAGNFRLAIRYWYLKTLHLLNGKNMISMAQDKTNYQYVNELRDPALRNDFASVTLTYEYAWYGEFEVDRDLYGKIETGFSAFVKKV